MSQFLPIGGYNWLYPKYLDQNKYSSNSLKGYASVVGYEYLKLVLETNNDYSSAPDEIEIQKEMLSNYQLDNFNKLVANAFDKEKYVLHYENLQLYLKLGLTLQNTLCIRTQSFTMTKTKC